jgi:cytochrome c-type biogenesis protein CcmH/NrfF
VSPAGQIAPAVLVPAAHIGHWLWVFYVLPVIIVIAGIFWSTRAANRREREEEDR